MVAIYSTRSLNPPIVRMALLLFWFPGAAMNANAAAAFLMEELNSFFSPYRRDATECSSLKSLLACSLTQLSSLRIDTNFFSVPVIFERTSSFSDGKFFLFIVVRILVVNENVRQSCRDSVIQNSEHRTHLCPCSTTAKPRVNRSCYRSVMNR